MEVLREESRVEFLEEAPNMRPLERYLVPGRHFTLHPVQLPPWLPKPIIHQMIHRFEVYVSEAIRMIEAARLVQTTKPTGRHSASNSMDSTSAYSDSSDGSKVSVRSNPRPGLPNLAATRYLFPLKD